MSTPTATRHPRLAKAIGAVIREGREALGASQAELSRRLGKSNSYVSQLERGYIVPSLPSLYLIAVVLEIDVHDLVPECPNVRGRWT